MSSAQTIVSEAYHLLSAIDINAEPSAPEMTAGLRALNSMIDSWAGQGLSVLDHSLTGDFTSGEAGVTGLKSTLGYLPATKRLAPGMNVTATGISARILSIDGEDSFTLDAVATLAGAAATIAFTMLPFQPRFEEGVIALLALRLAPLIGEDNIPAIVLQMARDGWLALQANFAAPRAATFDPGLIWTTNTLRIGS